MDTFTEDALSLLNEALAGARTQDGRRVSIVFEALRDIFTTDISLLDADGKVTEREHFYRKSPFPEGTPPGRVAAFAEGLRRNADALQWEAIRHGDYPCWALCEIPSLVSGDDFAHAMSDREILGDTLAAHLVDTLRAQHGLSATTREEARWIHALSTRCGSLPELDASVDGLAGSVRAAPYLLVLFEQWADRIDQGSDRWPPSPIPAMSSYLATRSQTKLEASLDAAGRERLSELRRRGLVKPVPLDIDALFEASKYGKVPVEHALVGEIEIHASGAVVACDPYFASDVVPIETGIPPGRYPVRIARAEIPFWGQRVAAARLDFAPGPVTRWIPIDDGFTVDSGLTCFMSAETRDGWVAEFEASRRKYPDGHPDGHELSACLAAGRTSPEGEGSWGLHRVDDAHAMAVFSSGLGDGGYETAAGISRSGALVALVIDFRVLPLGEASPDPS